MFQALKNFVSGTADKVVTKDDMRSLAEATFTAISTNVIPSLKTVLSSDVYFNKTTSRTVLLENMGGSLGLRTNDPKEVISSLLDFFKDVAVEEKNLIKLIDKDVNDKVFPTVATAQEVAIMKTISDLSSLALYTLDMLYYVIIDSETDYPDKKVTELKDSVIHFNALLRTYIKGFDKHVTALSKVSKTVIKMDAEVSLMDKMLSRHGKLVDLPTMNGFINNPIYHVRLWFANEDISKYASLKEKKKLIELRILDLTMRAEGKHDESLSKQIKYYEDKVSSLEYDIKDLVDDV